MYSSVLLWQQHGQTTLLLLLLRQSRSNRELLMQLAQLPIA
jgi:hypothetical protein